MAPVEPGEQSTGCLQERLALHVGTHSSHHFSSTTCRENRIEMQKNSDSWSMIAVRKQKCHVILRRYGQTSKLQSLYCCNLWQKELRICNSTSGERMVKEKAVGVSKDAWACEHGPWSQTATSSRSPLDMGTLLHKGCIYEHLNHNSSASRGRDILPKMTTDWASGLLLYNCSLQDRFTSQI